MIYRGFVCAAAVLAAVAAGAQTPSTAPAHVTFTPDALVWADPPPSLPAGARIAVLSGNPGAPGPFTVRVKFPAGYKVMPHWHPTAENVTVISGTFALGEGDTFDMKALHSMPAGSFSMMPAEMHHYAYTKDGATFQIHGEGPFTVNYVNAADDPRNAAAPKAR
jgi:quercetin dioxygenase-like cupin family protein